MFAYRVTSRVDGVTMEMFYVAESASAVVQYLDEFDHSLLELKCLGAAVVIKAGALTEPPVSTT